MSAYKSSPKERARALVAELYEQETRRGVVFRSGVLLFDIITVAYFVVTSFVENDSGIDWVDPALGLVIATDFAARIWISDRKLKNLASPLGIADLIVIASLLAPISGTGFAFLRVLRTLRLLRSYTLVRQLRRKSVFFRKNQQSIGATLNLAIFMFVTTAVVYETQRDINDKINNYVDALYFTVTTLTTTGFGDITLTGTSGKLLAVVIMVFGVSLFLRLVQVIMRPAKVDYKCPQCGLRRHDYDAVHCKACGHILKIEDEGST